MTEKVSHYELLGVSNSVDPKDLRKAFLKLSKELHPDTTALKRDEAAHRFQQVCEAYELLSDPARRAAYDKGIVAASFLRDEKGSIETFPFSKAFRDSARPIDVRRPLSGGELFSLFLLGLTLLVSLLSAIVFGFFQGRQFEVQPSWIVTESILPITFDQSKIHGPSSFRSNPIKSTFFGKY